jgi:catechol 2,3-dioxygenase-like lactoylglutathione lyase family enzyme
VAGTLRAVIEVQGLDHIVINCADVERSLAWYSDVLGLEPLRVEEWRRREAPFPSLRLDEGTIIDLFAADRSGVNVDHICLVVAPTDLDAVAASGRFDVRSGPAPRWGARGMGTSLYVHDPDGNTVELRHYG